MGAVGGASDWAEAVLNEEEPGAPAELLLDAIAFGGLS